MQIKYFYTEINFLDQVSSVAAPIFNIENKLAVEWPTIHGHFVFEMHTGGYGTGYPMRDLTWTA